MVNATRKIESDVKTMDSLFRESNFNIPFYQREYAWKKDEIDDLWNDLMDVVNGYQESHFFGQIVTYSGDEVDDLIDGQQRITTSSILLATINNIAGELLELFNYQNSPRSGDPSYDIKNRLSSKILKKMDSSHPISITEDDKLQLIIIRTMIEKNVKSKDKIPALTLQPVSKDDDSINEYFIGLFSGKTKTRKKLEPIKNIKSAYDKFYERIVEYIFNDTNELCVRLDSIFKSFNDGFFVSLISTKNSEEAFVIFETLNSRGKDLEPSEIIKTHLMSQISEETDNFIVEFNERWKKIEGKFNKKSDKLTKFIRVYWAASHRLVSSKQLYRSISSNIKGNDRAKTFLSDLEKVVDYYVSIEENNFRNKKDRELFDNSKMYEILRLLRKFKVTLHYPILFSMILQDMNSEYMSKILKEVLNVYMRLRVICMYGTNTLETGYAGLAEDIWNHKVTSIDEIVLGLLPIKTPDIEVKGSFQNLKKQMASGAKEWTLKYLLFKFYQAMDNKDFNDLSIEEANLDKYSVQYIGMEDTIDDNYIDYVGNYILIENTISVLREGPSLAAMKSSLITNQNLGKLISDNGWNEEEIQKRQREFSEFSVNIW